MASRRVHRRRRRGDRPTVSLACVSGSSPQQAHAFLHEWRPLVDEVVLAVEQDNDPEIFTACNDLVDRAFLLPSSQGWPELYLGWLFEECSSDWILRVDDDELPSGALRDALPGLIAERELTHVWLPRRWLFRDPGHYIAEGPWLRDIQVRLVRNVPGIWTLSGQAHTNLVVDGASRISAAPLLHLVTLITSLVARRAKAERYRELVGDPVTDGYRVNGMYVPEEAPQLQLGELAPEDRTTIEHFTTALGTRRRLRRRPARIPEPVPEDSIYRWVGARQLSADAYAATIRPLYPVEPMPVDAIRHIHVEVVNRGRDWLPRGPVPEPAVFVGHRWHFADGTEETRTPRTPFTELVGPGATTRLTVAIKAPSRPGRVELELDLVHEFVRWFGCPTRVMVDILEREEQQAHASRTGTVPG